MSECRWEMIEVLVGMSSVSRWWVWIEAAAPTLSNRGMPKPTPRSCRRMSCRVTVRVRIRIRVRVKVQAKAKVRVRVRVRVRLEREE